jgi:hypothetical protein
MIKPVHEKAEGGSSSIAMNLDASSDMESTALQHLPSHECCALGAARLYERVQAVLANSLPSFSLSLPNTRAPAGVFTRYQHIALISSQ